MSGASMMMGNAYPLLVVSVVPTSVGGSDSSSTVTSSSATASATGGSGFKTYAWRRTSGSASIVSVSPSSAASQFRATGMSIGSISAKFVCDITDSVTGEVKSTAEVNVYLERGYPGLSISGPAAIYVETPSSASIVVSGSTSISVSGGSGSYSISASGSGDFTLSGSGTSRTASRLLGPTGGVSGSITFTVTDTVTGETQSVSAGVVLINNGTVPAPLSVSGGGSVEGYSPNTPVYTDYASVVVSGGVPPYGYSWARIGGVGDVSGGGATVRFVNGMAYGSASGTFQCNVWDQAGNGGVVYVSASFTRFDPYIGG